MGFEGGRVIPDISCRVYHNADQDVQNSTWTSLAFNSERFDTDNIHSTTVNNARLTCQTAGKYLIIAHFLFNPNGVGTRALSIELNGATPIGGCQFRPPATAGNHAGLSASTIYDLAVGDYVRINAYQNCGGPLTIPAVGKHSPEFMMIKLA